MSSAPVEGFRLSPQQERLWALGGASVDCVLRVRGAVSFVQPPSAGDWLIAWRRVITRQEILRTYFRSLAGMSLPLQVIAAGAPAGAAVVELGCLPPERREALIAVGLAALSKQGFDPGEGITLRTVLLTGQGRVESWLLDCPGLRLDSRGLLSLVEEVSRLATEPSDAVEPPPTQYADLSDWMNDLLDGDEMADGRRFWRERLSDAVFAADLPWPVAASPGPYLPQRATLPQAACLLSRLRPWAAERGLSAASVLLAAWQVVLWRLTATPALVVAVRFSGRRYDEIARVPGLFAHSLPVESERQWELPFETLARRVEERLTELAEWQEFFDWTRAAEASGGLVPPYPVFGFELEELDSTELRAHAAGPRIVSWESTLERVMAGLSGWHAEAGGNLGQGGNLGPGGNLEVSCDRARIDEGAAEKLAQALSAALADGLSQPQKPARFLWLLNEASRRNVLLERNHTHQELGTGATIPELVARRAAELPEAIALSFADEQWSYEGLDAWAEELALDLAAYGVGLESRIGLYLERSSELIAAMLAILRRGAAYIPLDPSYPGERLLTMLGDAGAGLTVVGPGGGASWSIAGHQVYEVRSPGARKSRGVGGEPTLAQADALAYVIYTSGSTGTPKGVMISHRSILNRLLWMQHRFPLRGDDRVLFKTPHGFDASIWEIFVPLLAGARLEVALPGDHADTGALKRYVGERAITVLQLVPSLLAVLLEEAALERDGWSLRRLYCGGEALPGALVARVKGQLRVDFCNLYGPTEAAIDVTYFPLEESAWEGVVPIGRPLANAEVYLLDPWMAAVPDGLPGALYLGGVGLARGYLGQPRLTAERFLPHAFTESPGKRLYKSGDLARWRPDGSLAFLGRIDHQVKLRGFRIELGEIEACLLAQPQVREVLVVVRGEHQREQRLVAYIAGGPIGTELDESTLASYLKQRLPEYMVPSLWVFLEALPRLPNGKLDRNSLPAPTTEAGPAAGRVARSPRSATEQLLLELWRTLLASAQLGIDDDFFALGGHSLLATQLVARVRDIFRVDLRVRHLFEAPTVAQLATLIDELLKSSAGIDLAPIERGTEEGDAPLTFSQQRLWFLDQFDPLSSAYLLPAVVRLKGHVPLERLTTSLEILLTRQEALRATFPVVDGLPVQRILAPFQPRIPVIELSALGAGERGAKASNLVRLVAWRPFPLAQGPLLRAAAIRVEAAEHLAVLSMHHIVGDGWSSTILIRELVTIFAALCRGEEPRLPELPVRYTDFARWQRRTLRGELLERELGYWKGQLCGELPVMQLPFDRPRSAAKTSRAGGSGVFLDAELRERLERLGIRHGATLFMVLLAGFDALLWRWTGQTDLAVGTPIANRHKVEIEGLIGLFMNSLVLRLRLDADPTITELLARVREVALAAYVHQDMPFERLVEALQPERSTEHQPIFQVMFMLQNFPRSQFELSGLSVSAETVRSETAKYDLLAELQETPSGIFCGLEYKAELFDATTVERLARHYRQVLESLSSGESARLSELSLLTAAERQQLVWEWNDTAAEFGPAVRLEELVSRQVEVAADHIAVSAPGLAWSYEELWARSGRVASRLSASGLGPGGLVAVYLERGPEMVSAVLGTLRSGGAYVPMEVSWPATRVSSLVSSLGISRALVQGRRLGDLEELAASGLERIVLEEDEASWPEISPLPAVGDASALAYIIFTSGSTGVPKGVMVSHEPVVNLIEWVSRRVGISAEDRVLFVTSLCFDLSVFDIFGILALGGEVRVAMEGEVGDPEALVEILYRERITFWDSAPAALGQLVPFLGAGAGGGGWLRRVFLSGDWIPLMLPGEMAASFPGVEVIALGGATEATVWSNFFHVGSLSPSWVSIPYGRPISNARYQVLDHGLRPCPIGVEGDLYIGGDVLFLGYAGQPGATAAKNLPDAWSGVGGRMYKTGDRARSFADGTLEFLGRVDHQVKVRGYRIELGEIEAALLQHAEVREAVVLAKGAKRGEKRLVAYITCRRPGLEPSPAELRSHLRESLPEYMVPAAFVCLEQLPVTANGKLDRARLPEPDSAPPAGGSLAPPRNQAEAALAEIWKELLGREEVGVHDNFFELGGDSILGIQVVTRARQAGLELHPRDLFERQTIAELAAHAAEATAGTAASEVAGPAPLGPAQRWFFEADPFDAHHFNQALLLSLPAEALPALRPALEALLVQHAALRARFVARQDTVWQEAVPTEPLALEVLDHEELAPVARAEALTAAAKGAQASLDHHSGPVFRALVFSYGDHEPAKLLLVAHHLVVDGVSWRILIEDLLAAWRQVADGRSVELPAPTASAATWYHSLVEAAAAGRFDHERLFWERQLAAGPRPIPRDIPLGGNTMAAVEEVRSELEPEETRLLLRDLPSRHRAQLFEVFLAAVGSTLSAWQGGGEALVEIEGHGREGWPGAPDISRTVGWLTALYPLRLPASPDAVAQLRATKQLHRSVPGGGLGFGVLRYLSGDSQLRSRLSQPRPEVAVNYLGQLEVAPTDEQGVNPGAVSTGPNASPRQARPYLLEINASVVAGRFTFSLVYSRDIHHHATMTALAAQLTRQLRELIAALSASPRPAWAPADFPLASLAEADLERIVTEFPEVEEIYPLTPLQQGLLFHSLDPATAQIYQQQLSCRLRGALDHAAFRQAWQGLLDRHPALRTVFVWEDLDRPQQVVLRHAALRLDVFDWRDVAADEVAPRLKVLLAERRRQLLSLRQAPLVRLALVELPTGDHHFIWDHHHLLADGWSVSQLVREAFVAYGQRQRGEPLALPAVAPYRRYIEWLAAQDEAAAERFWRQRLAGFAEPTPIGAAPVEVTVGDEPYGERRLPLSSGTIAALRGLAARRRLTLASLVQGAWALLLSRYSGLSDVLFGAVSAGRPPELEAVETMIGLFINTLPVRCRLDDQAVAWSWLEELQLEQAEARQFEHSSLAAIQGWSEVPPGRALFDSLVVFENYPVADLVRQLGAGDLRVESSDFVERSNYALTLLTAPGEAMVLRTFFDRRRFDATDADRLLRHLVTVLESLSSGESARLSELSLLTAAERQQLVWEWNDTAAEFGPAVRLEELVSRQVEVAADHIAVSAPGLAWSYEELWARSGRVACRLSASGLGPGGLVAVYLERGPEMVSAVLGTLRCGGAYVPMEVSWPATRVSSLVSSLGISRALVQGRRLGDLEELAAAGLERIVVEEDEASWPEISSLPAVGDASALAYIIFTSGSTGVPKGVMVSHEPVVNLIEWVSRRVGISAEDRVLFVTSLCFDLSVFDIFGILALGGEVRVAMEGEVGDPEALVEILYRERITFWDSAPAALGQLVPFLGAGAGGGGWLRRVFLSGDWIPLLLPGEMAASFPGVEVIALGGATEATVWSNSFRVGSLSPSWVSIPYGRPISNARYQVLDHGLRPCPIGVEGDLYIGGEVLFLGYAGQPGATAAKNLPDAWSGVGGRMYKTGDRARSFADGTLEFLGRVDHQVKVRGYRIELGEIEVALLQHAEVREAVVLAKGAKRGEKRLVAYLTCRRPGFEPSPAELRSHLRNSLPEYMVPAAFVCLEQLPVTANGKLDRARLPEPDSAPAAALDFEPPVTAAEIELARIWEEVLGHGPLSRHDHFFERGGDSILSIQVVSRARRSGLAISPRDLFDHPVLAELAKAAGTVDLTAEEEPAVGEVALTPVQKWFFAQHLEAPEHFNQTFWLEAREEVEVEALEQALEALASHHDALRLRFELEAGQWRQSYAAPGGATRLVLLPSAGASDAEQLAAAEALQRSLDLQTGPLLVAGLSAGRGQRPDRLLLVAHHLVVDGVSWRILLEDLATTYTQLRRREPVVLPLKSSSFKSWAAALEREARTVATAAEREHWLRIAAASTNPLPVDHPSGSNRMADVESVLSALSPALTAELLEGAHRAYRTTTPELLLTALVLACWRCFACPSVRVDLESHGREELESAATEGGPRPDVTRTVGWFTAMYPLVLDLSEGQGVEAAIPAVKEQVRAVPRRGLGFGLLRYELQDAALLAALAAQPESPLVFNYLGQLDQTLAEQGPFRGLEAPTGAARHPLQQRRHLLEVNSFVAGGKLQTAWSYSAAMYQRQTVERLAECYVEALTQILAHCRSPQAGRYTPSDFPLCGLHQAELDRLVGSLAEVGARQGIESIDPLSPAQEGMLYESLAAPEAGLHVEQWSCAFRGEIDPLLFEQAWQRVVARHAALRTAFVWSELRRPLQVVLAAPPLLRLAALDLRAQPERLEAFLAEDARLGFDLQRPPLQRLTLVRSAEDLTWLVWSHHHILLDGWCRTLVLGEVLAVYSALAAGQEPSLAPAMPYRDLIVWLERQDLATAEAYWRAALSGVVAPTPLGRPAELPAVESPDPFATWQLSLDAGPSAELAALARRRGVTLSVVAQAAWALLLGQYGDRDDVVFGITVAGRPAELPGVERSIGLFINTLPLRVSLAAGTTLDELLGELQNRAGELRQWEHTPPGRLRAWTEVPSSLPLFESLMVFENVGSGEELVAQAKSEQVPVVAETRVAGARTGFALTLLVEPAPVLGFRLIADTRRVAREDAAAILPALAEVCVQMLRAANTSLGSLRSSLVGLAPPRVAPRASRPRTDAVEPPRGAIETQLAELWGDLLGLPSLDRRDNFFALGGHSLLATQLASRLRARFAVDTPLRLIFEAPSLSAMAARLERLLSAAGSPRLLEPIPKLPRPGELPLSHAQQRLWFLEQLRPGTSLFNIPMDIGLVGPLLVWALRRSLSEVVRRHETLRAVFPTVAGTPRLLVLEPAAVPLPLVSLEALSTAGQEARAEGLRHCAARRVFDLARGPLLRQMLIRRGQQHHVLVMTVHHILSDAWSAGIFSREVAALYPAFEAGRSSPLPELEWQYADVAAWERQWLDKGGEAARQLKFWRQQLAGDLPRVTLPADRERPAELSHRGATFRCELPQQLVGELRLLGEAESCTLFMVLMAAFKTLLKQRTGLSDLIVGTDVAGRNRAETEGLIGFFVNQLALRTSLAGNPSFRQLLGRVREVALGAMSHQELPFDQLVDALKLERSLSYAPLFQIKLFVTNTPGGVVPETELAIEPLATETGYEQLDLTLAFRETPEGALAAWVSFSTDLFEQPSIRALMVSFEALLRRLVAQPDARLSDLEDFLTEQQREQRSMSEDQNQKRSFPGLRAVKPQAVALAAAELVKEGALSATGWAPRLFEPNGQAVDLVEWAGGHRAALLEKLRQHGALLFRGFGIDRPQVFERFAGVVCDQLFDENGEHPRESLAGKVYTPVYFPPDQKLLMHNENSFNQRWPTKILFACAKAPGQGGETPLADSRLVYQHIDPEIREAFERLGVLYMRNYGDTGLGLSWQQVFQTEDRAAVEAACHETGTSFEWKPSGGLRTWALRPAVIRHPVTGEKVWFNQAQHWHIACLSEETRESMSRLFDERDLPRHCFFGDGSPIPDQAMTHIVSVYDQLESSFRWQQGDVVVVDNVLVAHARNPFSGERKLLVALGDMSGFAELEAER